MGKLLQEFTAADKNGKEYRLLVYQEYVSVGTRADPSAMAPVEKQIVTEDGESVNRLDKGKYRMKTGVILSSTDPDAP